MNRSAQHVRVKRKTSQSQSSAGLGGDERGMLQKVKGQGG